MTKIAAAPFPGTGRDVQGELTNLIATIGENMTLRRAASLSVSDGVVVAYMHNAVAPDLGKIGVLVALESTGDKAKLARARQAARHARGRRQPAVADRGRPRQGRVERERAVLAEKAGQTRQGRRHHRQDGRRRPAQVPPGGRAARAGLRHRRQDQGPKVVDEAAKEVGAPVRLAGFLRFALGEGIEKKSDDFAAEVAAQLKK